ncbi:MAG: hypothetical protein AAF636_04815 [Pseudomonadota bacterium]
MRSETNIKTNEFTEPVGDRHSIARQVLGGFLIAVRESNQIQSMVRGYDRP